MNSPDWTAEFARVISCERCDKRRSNNILRDARENVPQPGFIGSRYEKFRILLVGQNPAVPPSRLAADDQEYTAALRRVRDDATAESMGSLQEVLLRFVPSWPVHGNYFPLYESGLTLEEIAYCNIIRCRTVENARPSSGLASTCIDTHFGRWLDLLTPRAIVFIGKWAHDRGEAAARNRSIPVTFMNRERSLSSAARAENRDQVAEFVRSIVE